MSYDDNDRQPAWVKAEARAEWWTLTKARKDDKRRGIKAHALDMTDPWSATEQRTCCTDCNQHKGTK